MKHKLEESRHTFWWICCALFLVLFGMVILKYFNYWNEISIALLVAYPVSLTLFVAVKQIARHQGEFPPKLGQIFVVLWSMLFLTMEIMTPILNSVIGASFVVPEELFPIWIEVMVIYGSSEIAKKRFLAKKNCVNTQENN